MANKEQVFLYIRDEIEKIASQEEKEILDEAAALEKEAYSQMETEAKKDAKHQLEKELAAISSNASIEAATNLEKRTKKLVEKRETLMKDIFTKAKEQLNAFVKSKDYKDYLLNHIERIGKEYQMTGCILHLKEDDMIYKNDLIKAYGFEIDVKVDQQIQLGGFIIDNPDTHVIVDETLDTALENQKDWFYKTSGLMIR
ncbi:MAG: V-type ATP synthase subunit E [Faecalibacillus sp.]